MSNITATQKGLISRLEKATEKDINKILNEISKAGGEFIIKPLVQKYFSSDSDVIKQQILDLQSTLKDNNIAKVWVKSLKAYSSNPDISYQISATWQSGIDFSHCLIDFIDFIETGNVKTALEAITTVQENSHSLDANEKLKLKSKLEKINLTEPVVKALAEDLLSELGS